MSTSVISPANGEEAGGAVSVQPAVPAARIRAARPGARWRSLPFWREFLLRAPMCVKMMGIGFVMVVLLGAGLFWQIRAVWLDDEMGELNENGRLLATHVATRALPILKDGRLADLPGLLREMADFSPEVNALQVRDAEGRVLASTGRGDPSAPASEVTVPIAPDVPGSIYIAMSEAHVASEIARVARRLAVTIVLIALLGMVPAWFLARFFTRPIGELVRNARAVKAGNYEARATVRAPDEVGELAGAFNEMVIALQEKDAVGQQLLRKLIAAEDEERKRVARELHDHTGQALTSIIAGLASLKPCGQSEEQLSRLLSLSTQTLSEVHDLSRTLRPNVLDDLGLGAALERFCQSCSQRLGLKVTCETIGFDELERLPPALEVALFRISQEAIANATRHGQPQSIDVLLQRKERSILAVVEDDGHGFDARNWRGRCLQGDHSGLLSMEERARLLGGTLCIESRPGAGTSLFVELPLKESN